MTLPRRSARINGRVWRISTVAKIDTDSGPAFGLCDEETLTITVKKGGEQFMRDTLFHELCHAACPGLDEPTIREVERGVYAVLRDNAALRRWLFEDG